MKRALFVLWLLWSICVALVLVPAMALIALLNALLAIANLGIASALRRLTWGLFE
jgi:hypothetical protein